MSANLGTLTLDLIAKIGGFTGPIDKASKQSKQFANDVDKMGKAIGVGFGVAAAAATAAFTAIVSQQMGLIDNSAKLAIQLDTTYASIANIERAGELGGVGMDKIVASSKQLSINIGKAIQGTDAQVSAFDRLGLKAQEIYDLPLDQRIATINKALLDNVTASERAAVAADLYGAKNAKAMQLLDPETIAEAARQAEIFGLNLSDVDAAKVEMAGDAMSTFSLLADGAGKQLTVQLAPILQAIGELFLKNAEEAGGMGTAIEGAVDTGVNALAFLLDAADGVKRVFTITADALVLQFALIERAVLSSVLAISMGLNKLPGVDIDISGMSDSLRTAISVASQAGESINSALEEPLAGAKFKTFVADARAAAEDAAKSTVAARELSLKAGDVFVETEEKKTKAVKQTRDAIGEQIAALQLQVRTLGMTADKEKLFRLEVEGATKAQLAQASAALKTIAAFEQNKKIQEDYKALVADLRTEEEKRTDGLREQLKVLDAMRGLPPAERGAVAGRIVDRATEDAPEFGGLPPEVGGAFGEFAKLDDAERKLGDWYSTQMAMLDKSRAERADLSATWDAEELSLKQQHEDKMGQIEKARQIAGISAMGDFFGQLAVLRESDSKEGRALGKTAAIAQATINAYTAATGAYASASAIPVVGWVLGPIAAGAALAAGLANVAAIKGMAHDGIDSVPQTGTWLLEKGERVTTAETSAKLDATLASVQAGMSSGSSSTSSDRPVQIVFNQRATDSRGVRESNAQAARQISRIVRGSTRFD